MAKAKTLVGLDVHAAKVVAAILDPESGEVRFERLGGESGPVVQLRGSLPRPVRATYEAGLTGYGLARGLDAAEIDCLVAAPDKIPRARAIGSRPTVATPSTGSGCWQPESSTGSGCRGHLRKR